jgi:EAL domain-containing protein (putative c-di-GMP-specific phosphodiesterase class I)
MHARRHRLRKASLSAARGVDRQPARGGREHAERVALLRLGVSHGQGYFISRPQPLDALRDLLA